MNKHQQENFIRLSQEEAEKAIVEGNGPFGAVLVDEDGNVVASAHNTSYTDPDPTAHAEINLLRLASRKLDRRDLSGCSIFANAEPCSMCSSAIVKAKIKNVCYGAPHEPSMDPGLSIEEVAKHSKRKLKLIGGVLEKECVEQIDRGRTKLKQSYEQH